VPLAYWQITPPPWRVTGSASVDLLGGSLALTFLILVAWLIEVARWNALAARRALRWTVEGGALAIMASVMVLELYVSFRHGAQLLVPAGTTLSNRVAAALPNVAGVAVVGALPVVAAFALLHWQSGKSDVIGAPPQG
jgi:hypothetical protein